MAITNRKFYVMCYFTAHNKRRDVDGNRNAAHHWSLEKCKLKLERYHNICTRMAQIKNSEDHMLARIYGNRSAHIALWACKNGAAPLENSLTVS